MTITTRTLADAAATVPGITAVRCPDCRRMVEVNGAGWILHRQTCKGTPPPR